MTRKRSSESPQEASYRKEQDKLSKVTKQSLETIEESVKRKAADKSAKKNEQSLSQSEQKRIQQNKSTL